MTISKRAGANAACDDGNIASSPWSLGGANRLFEANDARALRPLASEPLGGQVGPTNVLGARAERQRRSAELAVADESTSARRMSDRSALVNDGRDAA